MKNFPYIKQIIVNDCYASKDIKIPHEPLTDFKHIILTGKNGSGKTTILNRLAIILDEASKGKSKDQSISSLRATINANKTHGGRSEWEKKVFELEGIDISFINDEIKSLSLEIDENEPYIFSFFKAHRRVELLEVNTITTEEQFTNSLKKREQQENFTKLFKQYLVNKKVYEAFDFMNKKNNENNQNKIFFEKLTETLQNIFEDKNLQLEFKQENFEFYIILSGGRKITFNHLSEGFSAFLSVIMDLLIRTDLIRKKINDFDYEPKGIVLIDEPETHLHLSMQYDILPLISYLFPNIQLIVATHSPAVISSIKESVVYDLSSKTQITDKVLGSSFSELMIGHFGLDNEYSPVADKILQDVESAMKIGNINSLHKIIEENERFLTPVLRLDIESLILKLTDK